MVRLRTLGECVIEVGENRIGPDSKVVFAMLVYLALQRGKAVPRSTLVELFWPDSSQERAAHSLRQTIYQCRKFGAVIEATKSEVLLPSHDVAMDLDALGRDTIDVAARDFLPGYSGGISDAFSEWLEEQRTAVMGTLRRRMLSRLGQHSARGNWEQAEAAARELLRIDPLNEEATLVLAESIAMRGNKAAALQLLDEFCDDVGSDTRLQMPATLLRRRIADQIPESRERANPFIGRDGAMEFLSRHLELARGGCGQTVLVWGDAGIGKTRLVSEFENSSKLHGIQVVKVGCQPTDEARPYSVFIDAIPRLLQLRGAIGSTPQTLTLLKRLTNHSEEGQDGSGQAAIDHTFGSQLRSAIVDLLDAIASERPLLFIIEDVHWLDANSWGVVSTITSESAPRKLLVLLTSRSEVASIAAKEGCGFSRFALEPLDQQDSRKLFSDLLSGSRFGADLDAQEWFTAVAAGNPYYLRELARHFADTGKAQTVPRTLDTLLLQRLRAVSAGALRFLQVCSLLGRHSTFERVELALQVETFELLAALEELEHSDLVIAEGQGVFSKHALLADQAVAMCTPAAKRLLHRRIAQVFEREILASRSTALLWTCADHWRKADDGNRASSLARSCAMHLMGLGLVTEAIEILESVMSHATIAEERRDLLRSLGLAYAGKRDWRKTVEVRETLESLRSTRAEEEPHDDDELRLLEAHLSLQIENKDTGDLGLHFERILRCCTSARSSSLHRLMAASVGIVMADNSLEPVAMDTIHSAVRDLLNQQSLPTHQRLWITMVYESTRGQLPAGVSAADQLISFHRSSGRLLDLIRCLSSSSVPLRACGEFIRAKAHTSEAVTLAGERELWSSYVHSLDVLATMCVTQGHFVEAAEYLERAFEKSHFAESQASTTSLNNVRTQALLAQQDIAGAIKSHSPSIAELRQIFARHRVDSLGLEFTMRCLTGRDIEASDLDYLLSRHHHAASTGRQDWPTFGLVAALSQIGRSREAQQLLTNYLRAYRREKYPFPNYFGPLLQLVTSGHVRID